MNSQFKHRNQHVENLIHLHKSCQCRTRISGPGFAKLAIF